MKSSTTSKRLKEIIDRDNLKQVDILRKAQPYCNQYGIKLTKTDLSQYISGKVEPGQEKLFILSEALGVDAAWLMGFEIHKFDKDAATKRLIAYYSMLNAKGKEEAEKRLQEMTQISSYTVEPSVDYAVDISNKRTNAYASFVAEDPAPYGAIAAHNDHTDDPEQQEKMQRDIEKLRKPE